MTDQEKVIKGLERCTQPIRECAYDCPYSCKEYIYEDCRDVLMANAIALLKAQEPRVMTLEEIIERKDSDAVWVEHMDGKMIVQPAVLLPSFLDTDKDCIHFASSWRTCGSYSRRSYGTKWRCWTSRPTAEQREATPWN